MYTLKNYFFARRGLFVYFLLILNLDQSFGCSSSEPAEYRVLKKTDSGGKQLIVAVDESAKLYCRTNVPWKKCIWKPPRNGVRQVKKMRIYYMAMIKYLITISNFFVCLLFNIF